MSIRLATVDDWSVIERLLTSASLPVEDLASTSAALFAVYERNDEVLGAIALEPRGAKDAMIRSLVVDPSSRRSGVGRALVEYVESNARERGFATLYLLTDSAEKFFNELGYVSMGRASAPENIRSHEQFRSLCPASAAFMHKALV